PAARSFPPAASSPCRPPLETPSSPSSSAGSKISGEKKRRDRRPRAAPVPAGLGIPLESGCYGTTHEKRSHLSLGGRLPRSRDRGRGGAGREDHGAGQRPADHQLGVPEADRGGLARAERVH